MEKKLARLKEILAEVADLNGAAALLGWDQQTYMPPGAAEQRGQQTGTLGRIAHEISTSPELGKLLEELKPYGESLDPDAPRSRHRLGSDVVSDHPVAARDQPLREPRPHETQADDADDGQ